MHLIALTLSMLATVGGNAAVIALESSAEIALRPYEHFDPNGRHVDASGDRTIWTTFPPGQHATLTIQAAPASAELPPPQLGRHSQRRGIPGVRIYVESDPDSPPCYPAEGYEDWRTDENGIFSVIVPVPQRVGDWTCVFRTDNAEVRTLALAIVVKSPNWIFWLAMGMLGGLGLFLYGMQIGSEGLQDASGSGFRNALHTVTNSPLRGVMTGTAVTFFTQSSSATTVMLVGFVRAGLINLRQSFGPIFGAAIGTTLTVQLLSFKIQSYALPLMAVGFLLMFFGTRSPRAAATGKIIFGFGMIFFGMAIMGEIIEPLKTSPAFRDLIARTTGRPLWCLLVVTIFTAVIQSSGATIGIALTLANQGLLDIHQSLPIIFGANIGTCVTAILASLGGTAVGKRVALAHLLFKLGTVAIFAFWFMPDVLAWLATKSSGLMAAASGNIPFLADTTARRMANADTIMCVFGTVVATLFFQAPLEKAVVWLVPTPRSESKGEGRAKYLDKALLSSPQLALGASVREISRMGRLVEEMVKRSQEVLESRDPDTLSWMRRRDDKVDRSFARINKFLTQLTATRPGQAETNRAIAHLYIINDLESIGDLVVKVFVPLVDKMIDLDLQFSEEGAADLRQLHALVTESLVRTMIGFTNADETDLFEEVVTRHEEMPVMGRRLHLRHLKRLQEGKTKSIETSTVHLDVVNYLLRMHYHIYSIAWTASRGVSAHEEIS